MNIKENKLNKLIKQTIKELRRIPKGGGEALTCGDAAKKLGVQFAEDPKNASFTDEALRQAKGKQINAKHEVALEKAAMNALEMSGRSSCTEPGSSEEAFRAFKEGWLETVSTPESQHSYAKLPDLPAQDPTFKNRRARGWDHIGETKVKISRKSLEKIIKEELIQLLEGGKYPHVFDKAVDSHLKGITGVESTQTPELAWKWLWRDLNGLLDQWPDKEHQYYKDLSSLLEKYSTSDDRPTRLPASAAPEPEDRWASLERAFKEE